MLESGLEAGQKVIVEGIQLVRPGQEVKTIEASLGQFQQTAPAPFNSDPRFSSKVSRLPGMDDQSPDPPPVDKKAEPESKNSPPDSKAEPDQRSKAPTQNKAR